MDPRGGERSGKKLVNLSHELCRGLEVAHFNKHNRRKRDERTFEATGCKSQGANPGVGCDWSERLEHGVVNTYRCMFDERKIDTRLGEL